MAFSKWTLRWLVYALQHVTWFLGLMCCGLAYVLTMGLSYYWCGVILPVLYDINSGVGLAHLFCSAWFSFCILFNHYHCATTNPGAPTASLLPQNLPTDEDMRRRTDRGEQWSRYCKTCRQWKPPRCHHCHFCNACVLKMDHHCPWINNCVGHHNQRFFMNMLLYVWLETGHALFATAAYRLGLVHPHQPRVAVLAIEHIISAEMMLTGALFVVMCFFLSWNGYLTATNQTVVEFYGNRQSKAWAREEGREWHNPFDLGLMRNLQEVYGYYPSLWHMLLPMLSPLPCDGHVYNTIFGPAHVAEPMGRAQKDDCMMEEDFI